MALKGDLASVDLAQVFQMLALNQKVGLLYIESPTSWKALYFDDRGVTLYFNEHVMLDRVLAKLISSGVLAAEGVQETREHAARQGQTTLDSLLAGGYMTEEELKSGFRLEMEEEIYQLFFWYDAKFEFFEGATEYHGKEGAISDEFFFSTDMLIMEAARRIDEWSYITEQIPNGLEILRPIERGPVPDLDEDRQRIYDMVDGRRNVDRLIEVTGTAPFNVFKDLAKLVDEGLIESLPVEEFKRNGRECMNEGRMRDAINLFERAVAERVDLPEVHALASEAYDAISEYELSAYHTKCTAEYHADRGNVKEAISVFRWVLETIPTDLEVCRRVVELSVGHPGFVSADFDPLAVGKELVDLYLEIGEVEQVRGLLEDLIRENPEDIDLKKSLINVHTKVGDTKRVIELYESIADDLTKQGDPIQAIKYLQKILQVDRSRTDISEWIKRLYQADERRRVRRRSLVALGMVFCLLVLASIGFYFYNQAARDAYEKVDVESQLKSHKFEAAIRVIDEFIDSHPFTTVLPEAKSRRREILARKSLHDTAEGQRDAKRRARLAALRYEYNNRYKTYRKHFKAEELDHAYQDLKKVREKATEAGQAQDLMFLGPKPEGMGIDAELEQLKTYLSGAARADRESRGALDAGQWRKGRELVLKLLEKYPLSSQAKIVRIPVRVESRPPGAEVLSGGERFGELVDGQPSALITPVVVLCANDKRVQLELRKEGFDGFTLTVAPRDDELVRVVMTIQPIRTTKWGNMIAQTAVGVTGGGSVAVGLSGGNLGLVSGTKDATPTKIKLPGLSEVTSTPVVTGSRVFVVTSTQKLVAFARSSGNRETWSYSIKSPLVFDPVVANSRVYLVDSRGMLICLSASNGFTLWQARLSGRASGAPTVLGRNVAVASSGGSVRVFDSSRRSGKPTISIDLELGVTTPVLMSQDFLIFGTGDGKLHAYSRVTKKHEWTRDVKRAIREHEFCMSSDRSTVYLVGQENTLYRINVFDGQVKKLKRLNDRIRPGIAITRAGLFVVVRETIGQKKERGREVRPVFRDLLLALHPQTLELQWRYNDGGDFRGRLVTNGERLYLTGSKGEVYRLQ